MATVVQGHKPGFQLFFFINQSVTFCYFLLLRWCNLFLSSSFPEPRLSSLPSLSISFLVCSPFIILLGKVNIFLRSFSTTSCNHKFHFSTLYSFLFFNAFLLFLLNLYGPFTQFFYVILPFGILIILSWIFCQITFFSKILSSRFLDILMIF